MNHQPRPEQPENGPGTAGADAQDAETGAAQGAAAPEAPAKGAQKSGSDVPVREQQARPRQGYLDPRGSESTREMRDTARRRRDAEEKLQQHLNEARDHIPNEHHAQPGEGGQD